MDLLRLSLGFPILLKYWLIWMERDGEMDHSLHEPHAEEELVGGGAAMVMCVRVHR